MKYYTLEQDEYERGKDVIIEIREFDSKAERSEFMRKANRLKRKEGCLMEVRKAMRTLDLVKVAVKYGTFPVRLVLRGKDKWFPIREGQ